MFDLNGDGEVDYGEFEKVSPQQAKPIHRCRDMYKYSIGYSQARAYFYDTGVRSMRLGVSRVNGFVSKEINVVRLMSLSAGSQCHPQLHCCWSQAQGPSCNREYCRYTRLSAHSEVDTRPHPLMRQATPSYEERVWQLLSTFFVLPSQQSQF